VNKTQNQVSDLNAAVTEKLTANIQTLVEAVNRQLGEEKDIRRKARNKRKARKRKARNK
jgi:hypothetical protein